MQQSKTNFAKKALVAGTIVAGTFFSAASMANTSSAFSFRTLGNGNEVRNELSGTTSSMNLDLACGANKSKDGKCGAKKDSTMSKSKDGKCGEGKCGGKKKDAKKKPSSN